MRKKTLQGMDDDQLLALYSAGEAVAGEILLGRYRPSVLDFFTRRLPAADADEQTQLVLEILSNVPQRTEPLRSTFRSFVFGVARMTLRSYCSRKANGRVFDPDLDSLMSLDPSLSSQLSELNRMSWLGTALETLSLESQMLLELRYGQRLGYREIAAIYEEPEPTIRRRMQLLKTKLQTMRQRYERRP